MDKLRRSDPDQSALTFLLVGDVDQSGFVPWMERHAVKLGVGFAVLQRSTNKLKLHAVGAPEMTHAFALACSLGPTSVHIDHLHILEAAENF